MECLESRLMLAADPVISEFMASNSGSITDGNGAHSDWIEILNRGDAPIDLAGWHLTDDAADLGKWTFPSKTLGAGQFLIVFASGNNAPDPAGNLHTNFSLNADGEYLALTRPNLTVASEYGAGGVDYPKQLQDVSYGIGGVQNQQTLIAAGHGTSALVPTSNALDDLSWVAPGFNDSGWRSGTTGVGFDVGGYDVQTPAKPVLLAKWTADDLNALANGSVVNSWVSSVGGATANHVGSPKLAKNQLNGHSVVHFEPSDGNDQFRVPAASNPMAGRGDFSLAVVFKTSNAGVGGASQWYNNTGLVDAEVGGVTNDWGLTINGSGAIGAGLGSPDVTAYSTGGFANGAGHVALYTRIGDVFKLYIDGALAATRTGAAGSRGNTDMVFGSLQTNINYYKGDLAEVQVLDGGLDDLAARELSSSIASKYQLQLTSDPYDPLIGLDLGASMFGAHTSAYVRVPFTVDDPQQLNRLWLDIRYDDGFVAYLNGVEVARRNAPGTVGFDSTALMARSDFQAIVPERIDISSFASLLRGDGAQNVLAIHALNSSLSDQDLLIIPELDGATALDNPAYFSTPTPGAANGAGFTDYVRDVKFSVDRGFYSAAMTVDVSASTPGASIAYTTDGSLPSPTHGTIVNALSADAAPVAHVGVSKTTVLRAVAFKNNYLSTNVDTETYVYISSVLTQPNVAPAGAYWDTQVDPDVVNATQTYSVSQALTAIPTISLVLPDADIFGPNGIYSNPLAKGDQWEREASVEYFDPNAPTSTFQIDAGLRIQGGVDRDPSRPKKSFRLFFRNEYGNGKLDFPILGADYPVHLFDTLILKGGHNYSWANAGGTPVERSDYLRDEFARRTQADMTGGPVARGSYVQLYINGLYWGQYGVAEEPDESWAASHFGGSKSDYDVIQPNVDGSLSLLSGDFTKWNAMFATADAAVGNDGVVDAAEYANIKQYLDVTNLADYMLSIIYRGDQDAPTLIGNGIQPRNFYALRSRASGGLFQFQTWDGELSIDNLTIDRTETAGNFNPARLYQQLRTNPEFRQLVADRVYKHFFNGGALSPQATKARYQELVNEINVSIVGESARWGDSKRALPGMRDTDWLGEVNWLLNTYFPQRTTNVFNQLKADFTVLNYTPPQFKINGAANHGGAVAAGDVLTLTDPNASTGTIYYTTDGSDPRLEGGGISPGARVYTGSIAINQNLTIKTRIKIGANWSPIDVVDYTLHTLAAPGNLVISEVNYHPADPTPVELTVNPNFTADDFEFIELLDTGNTTVDLLNAHFDVGISFNFGNTSVAPGQRALLVKNIVAFQARYGTAIPIAGVYTGALSNAGEAIRLLARNNSAISQFTYATSGDWPGRADGKGSSLELISTSGNFNDPNNWRSSYEYNGTPGVAGAGPIDDVVVNEILTNTTSPQLDAIELHNTTGADIDLSGWFISDASGNYKKFRIPDGTIISAGAYLVFDETDFNPRPAAPGPNDFALDGAHGDDVYLVKATPASTLLAFADAVHFDAAANGETLGRWPNDTGKLYPMATPTLGARNSGPRIGPVIITEVMYHPTADNPNLEYVEIQNTTGGDLDISGWKFNNGIDLTFAAGTILHAYEPAVVVPFDAADASLLAAFRANYRIDAAVRIIGPYSGSLSDTGETLRLVRPDTPPPTDPGFTPFVLVDEVDYTAAAPWPAAPAAGMGQALSRITNASYGDDPATWQGQSPSVGTVPFGHAYIRANSQYLYTTTTTLDSLTIAPNATVSLSAGGSNVLRTGELQIQTNARLDLNDGALIVDAAPSEAAATLAQVNDLLRSGYNPSGQRWLGAGIVSSAARNDAKSGTGVGSLLNDNGEGAPVVSTFFGQQVNANSILVRYTLLGDADLDADVDSDDLRRLTLNMAKPNAYWATGDFNYDGQAGFIDFQRLELNFGGVLPAPAPLPSVPTPIAAPAPARPQPPAARPKPQPVAMPPVAVKRPMAPSPVNTLLADAPVPKPAALFSKKPIKRTPADASC